MRSDVWNLLRDDMKVVARSVPVRFQDKRSVLTHLLALCLEAQLIELK